MELLKQADIVVTNPPFSLFREYVAQLVAHDKQFLMIGSKNAITYKEIFKLIKENKLWLGHGFANGNAFFSIPKNYAREFAVGVYDERTGLVKFRNVGWFTNMDYESRHEFIPLHKKHSPAKYPNYVNFNGIEVSKVADIPVDYPGAMGVPISFLDKHNPDQFEILGSSRALALPMSRIAKKGRYSQGGPRFYLDNGDGTHRRLYDRIVIKNRHL